MQTEKNLWLNMKEGIENTKDGRKHKFYRIENICDPGMPDLFYHLNRRNACGFIELKVIRSLKNKVPLRPAQINWIKAYEEAGGFVSVGIYSQKERLLTISEISGFEEDCGCYRIDDTLLQDRMTSHKFFERLLKVLY